MADSYKRNNGYTRLKRTVGASKDVLDPTLNTASSGTTIVSDEVGNAGRHKTVISIDAFTQAIAGANLGFGKKIYDFPEGKIQIHSVKGTVKLTAATDTTAAKLALGTVVGSGAVAVLTGTATFVDIMQQQTLAAIASTGTTNAISAMGSGTVLDGSSSAKKIFLNIAGGWSSTENVTIESKLTIEWSFVGDV